MSKHLQVNNKVRGKLGQKDNDTRNKGKKRKKRSKYLSTIFSLPIPIAAAAHTAQRASINRIESMRGRRDGFALHEFMYAAGLVWPLYSPVGMLSTSSLRRRQFSACSSEYFTRSWLQSWCSRLM
jgi:ribosomal protein L13E